MRTLLTRLLLTALPLTLCALPAEAEAAYLIPPGNSAVTQYTETIPTGGGDSAGGGGHHAVPPARALGAKQVRHLERYGRTGRAVAAMAAATAPIVRTGGGSTNGAGLPPSSGTAGRQLPGGRTPHGGEPPVPPVGRSRLGQIISNATGASGQTSLLLPLLIVAAVAWSISYLLKARKQRL